MLTAYVYRWSVESQRHQTKRFSPWSLSTQHAFRAEILPDWMLHIVDIFLMKLRVLLAFRSTASVIGSISSGWNNDVNLHGPTQKFIIRTHPFL